MPPDSKVYASDKVCPEAGVQLTGLRQLGAFCMAEIEFCPFRYQPRSQSLELVERIDLTLMVTPRTKNLQEIELLPAAWLQTKYFAERVRGIVLNPWDVIVPGGLTPRPTPPPVADHVIVTTRALAQNFQRLAAWRTSLGLRSRVVTVEDIIANSVPDTGGAMFWQTTGYYDGGTRDTAEAIRNFLKWANLNWAVKYVLLGGDTQIIPVRKALCLQLGIISYGTLAASDTGMIFGDSPMASSVKTGSSASNVCDTDPATVWECDSTDSNPWIRLAMIPHTPVNRVDLQWGVTYAAGYRIEVSNDGINWTSVYSTSNAPGGAEQITFNCTSGQYLRLVITSGTAFALAALRIYGPGSGYRGGAAYAQGTTVTRICLSFYIEMNPTNSTDSDLILTRRGWDETIVPYDTNANPANLGWFFIDDLINPQPNPAASPTRFVEIRGPSQFHGEQFAVKRDFNYIATDLYYSDLLGNVIPGGYDHEWDGNRNLIYGERYDRNYDGVNGMADVFVGRAPANTQAEADIFIDKIIRYEKYLFREQLGNDAALPQDFAVSVLLGSANWYWPNSVGVLDDSAQGKEDIRRDFLALDSSRWIFSRRYQDFADVPPSDHGPDLSDVSTAAIMAAIASRQNMVSLSGHGTQNGCWPLSWMDVDDEFSPPSIWYVNACDTNKFDNSTGKAFSELAMLNINGASVAYVGNSRFGFSGDNPMERAFWDELFVSGELGRMLEKAHLMAPSSWGEYSLNLLGDPAMRVWSDRPLQLTVTHASEVFINFMTIPPSQTFDVRVSSNGSPVSGASVCLVMGNSLFVTAATDASGFARLQIAPTETGTMSVSASGKNLVPYLGSVQVKRLRPEVNEPGVIVVAD